jgi:hypothetical protein
VRIEARDESKYDKQQQQQKPYEGKNKNTLTSPAVS